ncbi:putative helicase MOV-10 isoform X2 [Ornithodoros turicata]|uniref:putative helicase MOV-10 isoform X2 n=1 Tax=Ornithodoros turicata TaxID=34597 RepID=UPI003138DC43
MFTLIGKCVSYLLSLLESPSKHLALESTVQDESDVDFSTETGATEIRRGQITHLSPVGQYGLVDGELYFALSSVDAAEGDGELRVGASVRLLISKGSTVAKAVHLIRSEAGVCTRTPEEVLVAKVTRVDGRRGRLDGRRPFQLADGYTPEFAPQAGDWVRVHWESKDIQTVIAKMVPLRVRDFVGSVTQLNSKGGVVDGQVSFDSSAWKGGKPFVGASVSVCALESDQGPFTWRALRMSPVQRENKKMDPVATSRDPEQARSLSLCDGVDFGCVMIGEKHTLSVPIRNCGENVLLLTGCEVNSDGRLHQVQIEGATAATMGPGAEFVLHVTCNATTAGRSRQRLVLKFEGFRVERDIFLEAQHPLEAQLPRSVHRERQLQHRTAQSSDSFVVPGRAPARTRGRLPVSLPQFPVSGEARQLSTSGRHAHRYLQPLGMHNYVEHFQLLLHLEEIQRQQDLDRCSLQEVVLQAEAEFLCLHIGSGLAEGRPSLAVGDRVLLEQSNCPGPRYEGFVFQVLQEDVLLQFEENLHKRCLQEQLYWNVSFRLNRTPLRRCHMALRLARPFLRTVLFPKTKFQRARKANAVQWTPIQDCVNQQQRTAVEAILRMDSVPLPHVVFGPPGTGKSVTLVEALLQVILRHSDTRVLACAPSNSAADLLAVRIWGSGRLEEHEFVRLLSYQRDIEDVPESVRHVCLTPDDLERAARCRVVVSTVATAGAMFGLGLSGGHFSHAFVDEAGQLTEPECLIPLVLAQGGQVVLCGDSLQLGPVVRSRIACDGGLSTSLLERILTTPPYASNGTRRDIRLVTKLVDSYRCPEPLLRLYSKLFYAGELRSCFVSRETNEEFPVVFHGVRGQEQKELCAGPSWFNAAEALLAAQYVQQAYRTRGLVAKDVGVITPYRKQVEKIRLLMNSLGLEVCKVGSVEEFQGQERPFIIISTVRTTEEDLREEGHFGFLFNAKRFNVAISRASRHLVVLGDPRLLVYDPHWKALIDYAKDNNSCVGCATSQTDSVIR